MTNLEMVEAELASAKSKHPYFVDWFSSLDKCIAESFTIRLRHDLENREKHNAVSFESVLRCEIGEAVEAYAKGELEHARQELAQCAAVCIRGMEYIEAEIEKGGNNGH